MEINFKIIYAQEVVTDDIPRLDKKSKEIVKKAIKEKLTIHPELFGKPLRASLAGYRKLRVADYRIIFEISKQDVIIWVIGHRKDVYNSIIKRLK